MTYIIIAEVGGELDELRCETYDAFLYWQRSLRSRGIYFVTEERP